MAETIATNIRLPRALHADLAELAKAERRSLNAQIVTMLERAVGLAKAGAPTFEVEDDE